MSHICTASSKLALSTAIQSFFRAEVASGLGFPPRSLYECGTRFSHRNPPCLYRQSKSKRYFNSVSRLQSLQCVDPEGISTTSAAVSNTRDHHNPPETTATETSSTDAPSSEAIETNTAASSAVAGAVSPGKSDHHENPDSTKAPEIKRRSRTDKSKNKPDSKRAEPPKQKKKLEPWQIQKEVLKKKFKDGWNPRKKLSPDAIEGIRQLHATAPDKFTTPVLAEQFQVSPEAIRRVLKSKWRPSEEEMEDRRERWQRRHDRIWTQMAELGLRAKRRRMEPISDWRVLYGDKNKPF